MSNVIRPAAFVHGVVAPRSLAGIKNMRRRWIDGRVASIIFGLTALAWILALAGAAFAIRTLLVLCFATLAGRVRRVGVQARRS